MMDGSCLLVVGSTDGNILLFSVLSYPVRALGSDFTKSHTLPVVTARLDLSDSSSPTPCALSTEPYVSVMTHQSGVNALAVSGQSKSRVTVYSGGDDNCMVATEIDLQRSEVLSVQKCHEQHSAQITG